MNRFRVLLVVISLISGAGVHATELQGSITFGGGANLDTTSAGTATGITSWSSAFVISSSGDFAGVPFLTFATFSAPWSFNSGPLQGFWSVSGFTFDLTSSAISTQIPPTIFQGGLPQNGAVSVTGVGIISGNGFSPTNGIWSFTTQDPSAGNPPVFSFSAADAAAKAELGDFVWDDLNADGQQALGEPGIPGVTVTLNGSDTFGNVVGPLMQLTDVNGKYLFTNLLPGTYAVTFAPVAGYFRTLANAGGDAIDSDAAGATGQTVNYVLAAGDSNLTVDAGYVRLASIGDRVWNDLDADGQQDGGESGVDGVFVGLYTCAGDVLVDSTVTQGGGIYRFDVAPGAYYVKFANLPPGFVFSPSTAGAASDPTDSDANSSTGKTDCTTLVAGENDPTWDAGIYRPASIGDLVFNDLNANGVQDGGGEVGVDGVKVELFTCLGNVSMGTDTTAGGGLYGFTVPPGDYYVVFSNLPAGFVFSPSTAGGASDPTDSDANSSTGKTDCTTLVAGENDPTWDAGIYQPVECIPGTFTFSGSTALDGPDGNVRSYVTSTGVWVNVTAFSRVKSSGAWAPAYVGAYSGGLGVTDSGEGTGSGNSHTVDNIDRENYLLFEFSESVVVDRAFLGYVVTDSDLRVWIGNFADPFNTHLSLNDGVLGSFGFTEQNLAPNSATRWADVNAGKLVGNAFVIAALTGQSTCDDQFKVNKLDICKPTVGVQPATIGNFVWNDVNANGQQDSGEAGVAGVKVQLYRFVDNAVVATTTTPASGLYSFSVPPGDYQVKFSNLPAGFVFSPSTASGASDPTDSDAAPATGLTAWTNLTAGENDPTWDAGINKPTPPPPPCIPTTFTFSGSTATDGTDGIIRTFTTPLGVSVKVSAFSRVKSNSAWSKAYVGVYSGGLGVTDSSEGSGSDNSHTVDNIGRDNYLLFEFSEPVIVERATLGYVVTDSDLSVWIGTFSNPFTNHLTLSNAVLNSFGFSEQNDVENASARTANLNSGMVVGNALVIAASVLDSTPDDKFKVKMLDICKPVSATGTLPTPWTARDIGNVVAAGSSGYSGGKFTIIGSGDDIWNAADAFRYVYQSASGNCSIVAKVTGVGDTDPWSKAGVMIRETLNADSRHASVFVTPSNGVAFQWRNATGGTSGNVNTTGLAAPYWVKLVRSGNTFTASRSANGSTWTTMGSQSITMGTNVYIGLPVTAHSAGALCGAIIESVTATP